MVNTKLILIEGLPGSENQPLHSSQMMFLKIWISIPNYF